MRNYKILFLSLFLSCASLQAAVGINAGIGLPFVSQYGLNLTMGNSWTLDIGYNVLDVSFGEAETKLSMPEAIIKWHPMAGSFFIGAGVGQETLEVEAVEAQTGASASADVTATTAIVKLGWMWGKANEGFWFGMDFAYIIPSGGEVDVEADGVSEDSDEYKDVVDAGEQFAETSYLNITFARFGWLF